MLQQTQVATVIDYFNRFCGRFPDVRALAEADVEDVLRLWEGLGYYRRARQLHAAAKVIVQSYDGVFPENFEAVLGLPGIGRYTAGAVLSISRDQKLPVVEANTVRLYSRLVALRKPPAETAANRLLWEIAEALLPNKRCGRFNQAAMELGSLLCTPRRPNCDVCPLAACCQARRLGIQEEIPGRVTKMTYENRKHVAIVLRRSDFYFLRVCQPGSHWEGLWDFPRYDVTDSGLETKGGELADVQTNFEKEFGLQVAFGEKLVTLKHGVTKFRIALEAYHASILADELELGGTELNGMVRESLSSDGDLSGWFTLEQIANLPLNTTGRKLANLLVQETAA